MWLNTTLEILLNLSIIGCLGALTYRLLKGGI